MPAADPKAPTWEYRYDRGALLPPQEGPAGTLLVEGFAAREGILTYRDASGGVRRELVPIETLRASAAGLARAPVTLDHPQENVTPDNYAALGVGDTDGEVAVERGGFVRVRLAVRRRDAVDAIRAGKQELSPGYRVRLDQTPGEHPVYGRYDAVQVERDYNHLAIVDSARGGHEVRLRADAAYGVERIDSNTAGIPGNTNTKGGLLKPLVAQLVALLGLGQRFDSDDAALDAVIGSLKSRSDASEATTKQISALTAERDALKARADAADAKIAQLEAAERARIDAAAKSELEAVARDACGIDPAKYVDARSLKMAIAKVQLGVEPKADASDAYLDAFVEMAKASKQRGDGRKAGEQAWTNTSQAPAQPPVRHDGDVIDYSAILRKRGGE